MASPDPARVGLHARWLRRRNRVQDGLFIVVEDDMRRRGDPRLPDFAAFAGDRVVWHDVLTMERVERAAGLATGGLMSGSTVELAEAMAARLGRRVFARDDVEEWSDDEWQDAAQRLLAAVEREESPFRLGGVLSCDATLELPIAVVKRTYGRLLELGVSDVLTRLCYARYLLLHGPDWDGEAHRILAEIEPAARRVGLWDGMFGHHPVFYTGPA